MPYIVCRTSPKSIIPGDTYFAENENDIREIYFKIKKTRDDLINTFPKHAYHKPKKAHIRVYEVYKDTPARCLTPTELSNILK